MSQMDDEYMEKSLLGRPIKEIALGAKRQCTAIAKHTGVRCSRAPIVGGFVCTMHGGANPQAKEAARMRLRALVDPAIDALTRAITFAYADMCETCGGPTDPKKMAVVVKAAQIVLDRAGYAPRREVTITDNRGPEGWERFLTDEQLETMTEWIAAAKARAVREGAMQASEPIEAEAVVVEEAPAFDEKDGRDPIDAGE